MLNEWFDIQEEKPKTKTRKIMRIGICGSQLYENKVKIKKSLYELKQKLDSQGKDFIVVSGGRKNGADKYIKKYSLELGIKYKEFNPAHTVYNLYSALPENFYGKEYMPGYIFQRNTMMANYVDCLFVFKKPNEPESEIDSLIKDAEKKQKPVRIVV